MRSPRFWILLACAALALGFGLGRRGLNEPDEGRCAGIASEMFHTGDWITPRLYGSAHFNKPPLLYWCIATAYRAGGVNETTARATAALAALGTLMLTFSIGRRLFNETTALVSTAILLTSPLFFALAHIIDPNMLLTFCTTLALWGVISWFHEDRRIYLAAFYAGMALSFVDKGPVGMLIIALTLIGYRIRRRPNWPLCRIWSTPLALACAAISLAWFFVVAWRHRDLFDFFIRQELIDRFFTEKHNRSQPFYYYGLMLPVAVLPWLPFIIRGAIRPRAHYRDDGATRLLASWIVLPTIMFTLSGSKMPTYILPLLPALALWAGRQVTLGTGAWQTIRPFLFAIFIALALPVVALIYGTRSLHWTFDLTAFDFVGLSLLVFTAAAALVARDALRRTCIVAALLAISFIACESMVARNETTMGAHTTTRALCRKVAEVLEPSDRIILYERHPRGLSFYLNRPVTIPSFKFESQLPSDRALLGNRLYDDSQDVMNWFASTQRVFVVTNDRGAEDIGKRTRMKLNTVYTDSKYVVVCNREFETN